jgi:predicted O-methyltransferase YrrM
MRVITHFGLWLAGLQQAQTQTSARERACLAKHAAGKQRLVEIGVWHGVTTRVLRSVMDPSATLYAVDPYPAGRLGFSFQYLIAHREVGVVRNGRVVWVRTTGEEAARRHQAQGLPPVDFIFIDGDHTYEGLRADWTGWSPQVAPGGVVALHDSRDTKDSPRPGAGSVRYTSETILKEPAFEVIDELESLTVLRRRAA